MSGRVVQFSALHPSNDFQRRDLPAIDLVRVAPVSQDPGQSSGVAEFVVGSPEVRCRVRGTLVFVPDLLPIGASPYVATVDQFWPTAMTPSFFGTTGLWLAKRDESTNGSGDRVPTENLVGGIYVPRTIPDQGCLGYTFEAETCSDELWGRLTVDGLSMAGATGKWVLRTSVVAYQILTENEWRRVLGRFFCRAVKTCTVVSGRAG